MSTSLPNDSQGTSALTKRRGANALRTCSECSFRDLILTCDCATLDSSLQSSSIDLSEHAEPNSHRNATDRNDRWCSKRRWKRVVRTWQRRSGMPFRKLIEGDMDACMAPILYGRRKNRYVDCYSVDAKSHRTSNPVHFQVRVTSPALHHAHAGGTSDAKANPQTNMPTCTDWLSDWCSRTSSRI